MQVLADSGLLVDDIVVDLQLDTEVELDIADYEPQLQAAPEPQLDIVSDELQVVPEQQLDIVVDELQVVPEPQLGIVVAVRELQLDIVADELRLQAAYGPQLAAPDAGVHVLLLDTVRDGHQLLGIVEVEQLGIVQDALLGIVRRDIEEPGTVVDCMELH